MTDKLIKFVNYDFIPSHYVVERHLNKISPSLDGEQEHPVKGRNPLAFLGACSNFQVNVEKLIYERSSLKNLKTSKAKIYESY